MKRVGILLSGLIRSRGARCCCSETVMDRFDVILSRIRALLDRGVDMIITTGGMGPGKYDLMEQVFVELGGEPVYQRLRVRPGRSTLFGMIGQTPFFALPGPPPAVRILFHELVAPALDRMQGLREHQGLVHAVLDKSMVLRQTGCLHLKGGICRVVEFRLVVRLAERMEPFNAILHLTGETGRLDPGQTVPLRLVGSLAGLTV